MTTKEPNAALATIQSLRAQYRLLTAKQLQWNRENPDLQMPTSKESIKGEQDLKQAELAMAQYIKTYNN